MEPSLSDEQPLRTILERNGGDIRVAFVFGSAALGTQQSTSDLDIGVAAMQPLSVIRKLHLMDELAVAFGRPIDLIDLLVASPPVLRQILTKGVCILKTDSNLYAQLLQKLWYDQADLMPNYDLILRRRRERFAHG